MKKNFLFAMAMAAVFAGCSSDDDGVETGQNGSKGFMTFNVELPSISTTRAENDKFEEGDDAEYAVNDVTICLLNDANQILQFENPQTTWNDKGEDGINVQRVSATIEFKTEYAPAKALVVLNANSNFTFSEGTIWSNDLLPDVDASKFIKSYASNGVGSGITMTNAAIVVDGAIQDLTPIKPENISTTQAGALANPVNVYVERIVAKVSVANSSSEFTADIPTNMTKITLNNWELDITNKSTYPLRETDNTWATTGYESTNALVNGNRMIGTTPNPIRVYWAKDGNYSDEDKVSGSYTNGFAQITEVDNDLSDVAYCLENTFDVANQKQPQTTRVVFKATIEPANSDYSADENFFTLGNSSDIWTSGNLLTQISTYATAAGVTGTTPSEDVLNNIATAGKVTVDATFLKSVLGISTITDEQVENIKTQLGDVTCYVDGICYYVARIKHFGDDLTPWDMNSSPLYGDDSQRTKDFLGRYGVVRNNWYELKVTGIKKLGTPTIPTPEDTWDDEKEQYIAYKINILSWAKRSQNVEL